MDETRVTHIRQVVEPILGERQMELVELTCRPQGGQLYVRLLADRVGGITIRDCAQLNQRIGEALDLAGVIEGNYTVEVSSPGLDRPLASHRDFERAIGEDLDVETQGEDKRSKALKGMLLAVQAEAIVLKTGSGNVTVPLQEIRSAKKSLRW